MAPPAPAAAPAAPAPSAFDVADDAYLTGADFKRALAARQPDTTAVTLAASGNVAHVRREHAAIFAKYGPEVERLIASVPPELRTVDNLTQCVRIVRSDHVDEIAAERAQQLVSTMAPTLRPTGGGSAPASVSREASLESEKIPAEWKERARAAKITEETVADFCRANGMTPAQFYKQFDTPANAIVGEIGRKRA